MRSPKEMNVTGNWRKGDPCYKAAKNLAELCSCFSVLQKIELISNKNYYLAEAISKPNIEEAA